MYTTFDGGDPAVQQPLQLQRLLIFVNTCVITQNSVLLETVTNALQSLLIRPRSYQTVDVRLQSRSDVHIRNYYRRLTSINGEF